MSFKVCILAAGTGSRMGQFSQLTNKALLPIDDQAAITRIIHSFPKAEEYVIAVGWRAEEVKNYTSLAHPNIKVQFVTINPFEGPGSGPGYSLWQCRNQLTGPFFVVCADTMWEQPLFENLEKSWVGVAKVKTQESSHYCMIKSKGGYVETIRDKTIVGENYVAFIGLFFVHDPKLYFDGPRPSVTINGEFQLSEGLLRLSKRTRLAVREFNDWIDIGTEEKYLAALTKSCSRLRKRDEIFYYVPPRIIKYFNNHEIAKKRVARANLFPEIFTKVTSHRPGFFTYNFLPGRNLYEQNTPELFSNLLKWLQERLWKPLTQVSDFDKICRKFYQEKTTERLEIFLANNPGLDGCATINGKPVPDVRSLLASLDWEDLSQGVPYVIHGDLQFANILFDDTAQTFHLLDWRQDFAGELSAGDIYYDLAKLHSGLLINLDRLAKETLDLIQITEVDGIVAHLTVPQVEYFNEYKEKLQIFIDALNLSYSRVQKLSGLIFLNMAALHPGPTDYFLYFFGRYILSHVD